MRGRVSDPFQPLRAAHNPNAPGSEESTAIQWTLWGKLAENAAAYLGKGSHVNIIGRLHNNNFEKDGETVYGMAFVAEEIDFLDNHAEAEARRGRHEFVDEMDAHDAAKAATRPAAGGYRPAPVTVAQLIEARRAEDIGHSLWTTSSACGRTSCAAGSPAATRRAAACTRAR